MKHFKQKLFPDIQFSKSQMMNWFFTLTIALTPAVVLSTEPAKAQTPELTCIKEITSAWDFEKLSEVEKRTYLADALIIAGRGGYSKSSYLKLLEESYEKLLSRYSASEDAINIGKPAVKRAHVPECGLSGLEMYSIKQYSLNIFYVLNKYLRTPEPDRNADLFWLQRVSVHLTSALKKFNPYVGKVKRGASVPTEKLMLHQTGSIIKYASFTSTSITKPYPGQQFEISSLTGRYIDPFSFYGGGSNDGENEVLIPSSSYFLVVQGYDPTSRQTIILEEISAEEAAGKLIIEL